MKRVYAAAVAAILVVGVPAMAEQQKPLSAEQSDPKSMGWMQEFPPPADQVIRFTDPDYFAFPKLRWTVCVAGTTMMACPEALMTQARRLLVLLSKVTGYRIDDTGALVLTTPETDTITARRRLP